MTSYDVIVIGLGGMGSAAAYHLAERGQRVLGLERFGPGHDRGASHGGSRIIRQSYFEDPAYVPLLLRSYELWQRLEYDAGPVELMAQCGGLMIGPEYSAAFAGSRRSAELWGLPHEVLNAREIRQRFPTLTPRPDEYALYEKSAGFVRPEATVLAHLELARRCGAELRFGEQVEGWEVRGDLVQVRTAAGVHMAERLVVCPGAWAGQLLQDLAVPLTVERHVQFWFEPGGDPASYGADRHPIYVWEDEEGVQIYGFPADRGSGSDAVKVAFFRRGRPCTADTIDREVSRDEVREIAAYVAERLPGLPNRFLKAAACMYTLTPDRHFVIGRHPGHEQVTIGCGFSGHGFKFVPVVGEILADLATTGTTRHDVDLFDPLRPALRESIVPAHD
jgi:sarcosine oxidase